MKLPRYMVGDRQEQAKVFFPDKNVKHWGVAVMDFQREAKVNSATQ